MGVGGLFEAKILVALFIVVWTTQTAASGRAGLGGLGNAEE